MIHGYKTLFQVCMFVMVASVLSGCLVSRTITRIEDHPQRNVTILETVDVHQYLFYGNVTHQFWQCGMSADLLSCQKICGLALDVDCPASTVSSQYSSANVSVR